MDTDSSRMLTAKTILWAAFGAACAFFVARWWGWDAAGFLGSPQPVLVAGALGCLLLLVGAAAVELGGNRHAAWMRWLALAVLLAALAVSGQPLFAALASVLLVMGMAAPVALVVLALVGRSAPARGGATPVGAGAGRLGLFLADRWFGTRHAAALAWVAGAALAIALAELGAATLAHADRLPTERARTVQAVRNDAAADPAERIALAPATGETLAGAAVNVLLVDGAAGTKVVLFDHAAHRERNGGDASCGLCHHRNLPLDRGTPCDVCHTRSGAAADTFDHASHTEALGGNASCARCHADGAAKTRAASTRCDDQACHARDIRKESVVRSRLALPEGVAPGYVDAMHGLCVDCHRQREAAQNAQQPYLSRCTTCHRLVRTGPSTFAHDTLLQPEVELERLKLEKAWIGRTAAAGAATPATGRDRG